MPKIAVIGAGVIGLTTALELIKNGYNVTVIAEYFPNNTQNIHYCSPKAGGHHVSFAKKGTKHFNYDKVTFNEMWKMSNDDLIPINKIDETEYFIDPPEDDLDFLRTYPSYRVINQDDLPSGVDFGVKFKTVSFDVPAYLSYLQNQCLQFGVQFIKGYVNHIEEIKDFDSIVICSGNGTIGGIEDTSMFTVKGITVTVKAKHIDFGMAVTYPRRLEFETYIIPRMNEAGEVILGGTRIINDHTNVVDNSIIENIKKRCLSICPSLASTIDDLEVIGINCGLRPARREGIRLEKMNYNEKVLFYCTGAAGSGYQSSIGCAKELLSLMETHFKDFV